MLTTLYNSLSQLLPRLILLQQLTSYLVNILGPPILTVTPRRPSVVATKVHLKGIKSVFLTFIWVCAVDVTYEETKIVVFMDA